MPGGLLSTIPSPLPVLLTDNTGGPTLNVTALLFTPLRVTNTLCPPIVAVEAIENFAAADVGLRTTTSLAVMPGPALIVILPKKFVPVSVTDTMAPWPPLAGVIEVNDGASAKLMLEAVAANAIAIGAPAVTLQEKQ
jgi:hypothetical protein